MYGNCVTRGKPTTFVLTFQCKYTMYIDPKKNQVESQLEIVVESAAAPSLTSLKVFL